MKIKVHVTKEIILKSSECDGWCNGPGSFALREGVGFNCAISLAVHEIIPDAWVERKRIVAYKNWGECVLHNPYINIPLPEEAERFTKRFDDITPALRIMMEPISFEIEAPDSFIETIGIQELETILSKSETLERV